MSASQQLTHSQQSHRDDKSVAVPDATHQSSTIQSRLKNVSERFRGLGANSRTGKGQLVKRSSAVRLRKSKTSSAGAKTQTKRNQPTVPHYTALSQLPTLEEEAPNEWVDEKQLPRIPSASKLRQVSHTMSQSDLTKRSHDELVEAILALRIENEELRSKDPVIAKAKDSFLAEDEDLKEARRQIHELQQQSQAAKNKVVEMEREVKKMVREMALATKLGPNQFDDTHIRDEVARLRYQVFNWVASEAWQMPNNSTQNKTDSQRRLEQYQFLRTTCPRYVEYVASIKDLKRLIQAHEHVELLHEWRATSARLLTVQASSSMEAYMQESVKDLVMDLLDELKPLTTKEPNVIAMRDIFLEAVHLDQQIQMQKQQYKFLHVIWPGKEYKPASFCFSENSMEIDDEKSDTEYSEEVTLVVAPGVKKNGNSAGKNYGQSISILKSRVDVMKIVN
ncbi:hypothetical protein G7Y89_g7420 [Cudoniella acicularis]|uniref:Uncharacterized protein n=1 Tax=Cudoniella acicularis TaxID=354080 RepID=A0A8H4RM46_9HELO|nr:hypothetical protein G7Y89_g7420 [Cudoniella acicularis]